MVSRGIARGKGNFFKGSVEYVGRKIAPIIHNLIIQFKELIRGLFYCLDYFFAL